MPTSFKKVSSIVNPHITHVTSSRKRKQKTGKGKGIMKENEAEKEKKIEKIKHKLELEPKYQEEPTHDQGFLDDTVQIIEA